MKNVKIIAFAGSLRKDSFNKKLIKVAASGAQGFGALVTVIDLKDYPMPIYDGDLEQVNGLPENAKKLKRLMIESDGFLISSPEYNSSISAVLKNTIDWISRPEGKDEPPLAALRGKVASVMSASPGAMGGLQSLAHIRAVLSNLGVLVLPNHIAVGKVHEAFNNDGTLKDETLQNSILKIGRDLAATVVKLKS